MKNSCWAALAHHGHEEAGINSGIVDGPVRVFRIAQPIGAVETNAEHPYVSLISTRTGSLTRLPAANSSAKRSTSECRSRTTPVVAERLRADGVKPLLVTITDLCPLRSASTSPP